MKYNDAAKTSLVSAFLFYNPCSVLNEQFVLVMVTRGPGMTSLRITLFFLFDFQLDLLECLHSSGSGL